MKAGYSFNESASSTFNSNRCKCAPRIPCVLMAHRAMPPKLLPGGYESKHFLAQHFEQRPLEGIELAGPPRRLTGMLNEAPLLPTEVELRHPLATLKHSGPRRAERRKRKPMAISGFSRSSCLS